MKVGLRVEEEMMDGTDGRSAAVLVTFGGDYGYLAAMHMWIITQATPLRSSPARPGSLTPSAPSSAPPLFCYKIKHVSIGNQGS